METKTYTKEEIINLLNDPTKKFDAVEVKYRTVESRSYFLTPEDTVWDDMQENYFEDVEIFTRDEDVLRDKVEKLLREEITKKDLEDKLKELEEDKDMEEFNKDLIFFLKEYIDDYDSSIYTIVNQLVENANWFTYDDSEDLAFLCDELDFDQPDFSEILQNVKDEEMEGLGYNTVYWRADSDGIYAENANKAGLIAFSYDNVDYLALGGCGMDLSPKLDAYIAFTYNRIPVNSMFFSDRSYFETVIGKTKTEEVERCITMDKPEVNVRIY